MTLFWILYVLFFGPLLLAAVIQIVTSQSNLNARKRNGPRPRHSWQRWALVCRLRTQNDILDEKESGWYPFQRMAESSRRYMVRAMLPHNIGGVYAEFQVKRLPSKRFLRATHTGSPR